jgi:inner membrane protein involved in colicin E2 resistance
LAKSGQKLPVEPIIQLVMPPLLIDGLILALTDQKAKYEKTVAQQVKNNEAQHQHLKSAGTVN